MFLRSDHATVQGGGGQSGGAVALAGARFAAAPARAANGVARIGAEIRHIDWTPDLGARIGSADWWRGVFTCVSMIGLACWLAPGLRPLTIGAAPGFDAAGFEQVRAQSIAPLGWGATTGHRMAANDLVRPLAETPERPIIELSTTIGSGDRLTSALVRAGVGGDEAARVGDLVARSVALDGLSAGTQIDLTLGRRTDKSVPRPLEALRFRARFDLAMAVTRVGGALVATPQPIAIDNTPLRIRGVVGQSLYRSARAAGAPAKAVEAYIRAIAERLSISRDLKADDVFDIAVKQQRAATGEVRLGDILYAGLDRDGHKLQLVRWDSGSHTAWFDANGVGPRHDGLTTPVEGHLTSSYGVRLHPILGILKMHKGLDIGAPYGAPIHAVSDGTVEFAGRNGGYGNFVKLTHPGGLESGYGHMSRIVVSPGTRVSQGQIIGYVGSTGLSTGPHVHYELWKNGVAINPRQVAFATVERLTGGALRALKARVAALLSVQPAHR